MPETFTLPLLVVTADRAVGERLAGVLGAEAGAGVRAVVGVTDAIKTLRGERFGAVVAAITPGDLDAIALARALRAAGDQTAVLVLGERPTAEIEEAVHAAGGDGYRVASQTSPRCLLAAAGRAAAARDIARENSRLRAAERGRLARERDDAERLLADQRALIGELEGLPAPPRSERAGSGDTRPIAERYAELLRAYVVEGSGGLADEIGRLAEELARDDWSGPRLMELHVGVVAEVVEGVGPRGGRHVLARADLLALEATVHLAEAYRRRYAAAGAGGPTNGSRPLAEAESEAARRRLAPWVDRFAA